MSTEKFTYFWRSESPFSNWHLAEFSVDDTNYNCTEQYMMYQKAILFGDEEMVTEILKTSSPKQQKALGRKVKNFDVKVWETHCKQIVYDGNHAKFTQNESLLQALMATEGTTIVEASPFDRIWGIGLSAKNPKAASRSTWRGKNWLGEVLTQLREDLKQRSEGTRSVA